MKPDAQKWQGLTEVVSIGEVRPGHYSLRICAPEIARISRPGQFLHILCGTGTAPLLRRPISICRADPASGLLEVIFRVVGEGTALLSRARPGERIDVMGPLGSKFQFPEPGHARDAVIVGGGVGIPPLLFLAEILRKEHPGADVHVLLGGRSAEFILCDEAFRSIGCPPEIATDDGSLGHHGLVTDLLSLRLSRNTVGMVYTCGPTPMLKAVANLCGRAGTPCQASFEARMACGVGACLSCVIPTRGGYRRVCTEGPVFPADEIAWHDVQE